MQQPQERPGKAGRIEDTGEPGGAGGARVLVVDDDPTVAEVVSGYLDRAGYIVERAEDGPRHWPGPTPTGPTWWCST